MYCLLFYSEVQHQCFQTLSELFLEEHLLSATFGNHIKMVMDQLWFILDMVDSVGAFKFVNECLWNSLAELVVKLSE